MTKTDLMKKAQLSDKTKKKKIIISINIIILNSRSTEPF